MASKAYSDPKVRSKQLVVDTILEFSKEIETAKDLSKVCIRYAIFEHFILLYIKNGVPKSLMQLCKVIAIESSNYNYRI